MKLEVLLNKPSTFVLFTAPPAWGKTSIIIDLIKKTSRKIIFISPLRALAEEFSSRVSCSYLSSKSDKDKEIDSFTKKAKVLVTTPEMINEKLMSFIEINKPIIIIDEFHLFYYWGETFRPLLWEKCLEIANTGASILGLTATMGKEMLQSWKKDFQLGMSQVVHVDMGNQQFLYPPENINNLGYLKDRFFKRIFIYRLNQHKKKKEQKTIIYFCKFRNEVDDWLDYCHRHKIPAIGCVGGQTEDFILKLKKYPNPVCIFSTSTLSHGVNLPRIGQVFLSYKIKNIDFWLQMSARGGRDGKGFVLYTKDIFFQKRIKLILSNIYHYIFDFYLRGIFFLK